MDGIINFNKPTGITSCKAVNFVKKAFQSKKAGHTGTLDPNASGVLPVCLGKATQIVQFVINFPKTYRGTMRLGIRTDSQDAVGKVIAESTDFKIEKKQLEEIFKKYVGAIEQIPPMFSAVRVNGERLYNLARKGITIERKPKKVFIYYFKLLDYHDNLVDFEAKTSAGAYIRTLCDDIGMELGCGAHLAKLSRTRVGGLKTEDALTMEEINRSSIDNGLRSKIYSMDEALSFLPYIKIKIGKEIDFINRRTILPVNIEDISGDIGKDENCRVHNASGKLLGIASPFQLSSFTSSPDNNAGFMLKKIFN